MPPELALIAVAHYLEALEMQAEAARVIAIMGGKFPHFMTSLPGGTAWVPDRGEARRHPLPPAAGRDFVDNTMIPDTLAIAPFYTDALSYGGGHGNFLSWGVFNDASPWSRRTATCPTASIFGRHRSRSRTPIPTKIKEYVKHSWYSSERRGLNPPQGKTNPEFTKYDIDDKYSWAKAPRYDGKPMEAGPLSRMLVAYLTRRRSRSRSIVDVALAKLGAAGKPEVLVSLLGRVAARNLEAAVVADWALEWVNELVAALKGGDVKLFEPSDASRRRGRRPVGGAPRRSRPLDERRRAADRRTTRSARRPRGTSAAATTRASRGAARGGPHRRPVSSTPSKPMEALRIVRSFDP